MVGGQEDAMLVTLRKKKTQKRKSWRLLSNDYSDSRDATLVVTHMLS